MRGRRPHPTAVQLLRNNPGGRPLNRYEPKHDELDPAIPDDLTDPRARAEWSRIVATLSHGHVTVVDRATLLGYCEKYAQWRALEVEATKHPYIVKSPNNYPIPNPALGMANTAYKLMLKSAAELGITPSSRSRIALAPAASDGAARDEFTRYQQRRFRRA